MIDGIDLYADEGEILGIVGGSGSGKSTMLKHIICLGRLTSGSMFLDGKEYTGSKPRHICRHMQMIFQESLHITDKLKSHDDNALSSWLLLNILFLTYIRIKMRI